FREREIWLVACFIFFWTFSPSFGPAFLFYQTDTLHFDQQFIGHLGALSSLAGGAGAPAYSPPARPVPLPPPRTHPPAPPSPPAPRPAPPRLYSIVPRRRRLAPSPPRPPPAPHLLPAHRRGPFLLLHGALLQRGRSARRAWGPPPLRQLRLHHPCPHLDHHH